MNNKLINQAVGHVMIEMNATGNTSYDNIKKICASVKVMMWYLYGDDIFETQDLIEEVVGMLYKKAA